ncbi:MAG: addiction module toxin RelE [Phycisphaerales bacterium]|nr:addiction module toxin RelE [Phycisphaerales bacterium]
MSRRLIIRGTAKLDLARAALWYQQKRISLGDEFLEAIGSCIKTIAERPTSFPIVYKKDVRRALTDRFPYAIYFVPAADYTAVIAILHTSQDHVRHLRRRHRG